MALARVQRGHIVQIGERTRAWRWGLTRAGDRDRALARVHLEPLGGCRHRPRHRRLVERLLDMLGGIHLGVAHEPLEVLVVGDVLPDPDAREAQLIGGGSPAHAGAQVLEERLLLDPREGAVGATCAGHPCSSFSRSGRRQLLERPNSWLTSGHETLFVSQLRAQSARHALLRSPGSAPSRHRSALAAPTASTLRIATQVPRSWVPPYRLGSQDVPAALRRMAT